MKLLSTRRNPLKRMQITSILIFSFILLLTITVLGIGYNVFSNWYNSAQVLTNSVGNYANTKVAEQISIFFENTMSTGKLAHGMIERKEIDLTNEQIRDSFFVNTLQSSDKNIYSLSYGTANGDYFGARRGTDGNIQIMRADSSTYGVLSYYAVNEDGTAGEATRFQEKFDPRMQIWYQDALKSGTFTFTPIYRQSTLKDMALSYSCPVWNENGVQGVISIHILLSGFANYLNNIVEENGGYAVITERDTKNIIANSEKAARLTVLDNGALQNNTIDNLGSPVVQKAYAHYQTNRNGSFNITYNKQDWLVSIREYNELGFEWLLISVLPSGLLTGEFFHNIRITAVISGIGIFLAICIHMLLIRKLFSPMQELLLVCHRLGNGQFDKRVKVMRNDEIGQISVSFNHLADRIQQLVTNLEDTVAVRTEELHRANEVLSENEDKLRLILDTTAEGIFGTDLDGRCTFCNKRCLELLGCSDETYLLGKNMHPIIHHTRRDGTPCEEEQCDLNRAIYNGKGAYSDSDIFWRADGSSFDVEYHSLAQYKDGQMIGTVVTFANISERKKDEQRIRFLSSHDALTGLFNRHFFQKKMEQQDTEENLPISMIFVDINGLKMVNDAFGHADGDLMIKKIAEVILRNCRDSDTVARVGGDEFTILLPKTTRDEATAIMRRLKEGCTKERINIINCSIAAGVATKAKHYHNLEKILEISENEMYKEKAVSSKEFSAYAIDCIINKLHEKSPWDKRHSDQTVYWCKKIGRALGLAENEIRKLRDAGYLHDIGKITMSAEILGKAPEKLTETERELLQQHPAAGYRILNLSESTLDLANSVYGHHERWDGTGFPKGLKGEEIPLISRIIAVAESYESALFRAGSDTNGALDMIEKQSGGRFDPEIVNTLIQIVQKQDDEHS